MTSPAGVPLQKKAVRPCGFYLFFLVPLWLSPPIASGSQTIRMIYLNGVEITTARGQKLQKVDIQIADNGDIYIVAPHYQVHEEDSFVPLSSLAGGKNFPTHQSAGNIPQFPPTPSPLTQPQRELSPSDPTSARATSDGNNEPMNQGNTANPLLPSRNSSANPNSPGQVRPREGSPRNPSMDEPMSPPASSARLSPPNPQATPALGQTPSVTSEDLPASGTATNQTPASLESQRSDFSTNNSLSPSPPKGPESGAPAFTGNQTSDSENPPSNATSNGENLP